MDCLVHLAKHYKKTIILSIHQPRSNIFSMIDRLLLLTKGQMVYSGPTHEVLLTHFEKIGFKCPPGYNMADYLSTTSGLLIRFLNL